MGTRTANEPVESFDIGGTDNMMLAAGVKENILFWDLRKTSPGKQQQADAIFSESHNEELTHVHIASLLFLVMPNLTQHALFSSHRGLVAHADPLPPRGAESVILQLDRWPGLHV
jgi:hypothetical protein